MAASFTWNWFVSVEIWYIFEYFCIDGKKASIETICNQLDNETIKCLVGVPKIILCDYRLNVAAH